MGESKNLLLKGAMTYGLALGIFWISKYIFFMLSLSIPLMSLLYWTLTILVPLIAYRMTRLYRLQIGGKIGFFHAWQFGILLYFFAALIVSLVHYAFYRYVAPPGFVTDTISQFATLMKDSEIDPKLIEALGEMRVTPIQMAIQGIFNNFFYGIILSIPVAAILCKGSDRVDHIEIK